MAIGWPALTAIGGVAHVIERKTGLKIEFAVGMKKNYWKFGTEKLSVPTMNSKKRAGRGTVGIIPGYVRDQIKATAEIIVLFRTADDHRSHPMIVDALKGITRLAGGSLFDVSVSVCSDQLPPAAAYLIDAGQDVKRLLKAGGHQDSLDAALSMYGADGEWKNGEWFQSRNGYTLNQSGYALLEAPKIRKNARSNLCHAWVEPVFSLVTQGSVSDGAWWRRETAEAGVAWRGGQ